MEPRLKNQYKHVPDSYQALRALEQSTRKDDLLTHEIQELVRIRASQINGCGFCLDMHVNDAKAAGETDERLHSIAGWREAPWFTEAERAALALTEAMTRLPDSSSPVPDDIWDNAAKHFDDQALMLLVVTIATINTWNRINVTTRQVAGSHRRAS
ncbi:carboxymuconolactone decarboxylase family protein [Saccharopolyspora taberi]